MLAEFLPSHLLFLSQKYGFVLRLGRPFTVSGHDPLCACRLCFSVEVPFASQPLVDVAAHGAEPDVRHVQDRVFHLAPHFLDRVQIGRHAAPLLPDEFRPVLRRAVG